MVAVRLISIAAHSIIDLTSPRCDRAIVQHWKGKRDWHDPFYEPLRDLMERTYIDAFNAANGHYRRLEEDIVARGIRNPVMLVSGRLQHRHMNELPSHWRHCRHLLASEYLGGSRLHVARRRGLNVPAIVNDFGDLFTGARELHSVEDVAACFEARPRTITLTPSDGAYVNDMVYSHMPEGYSLAQQIPIRAAVVEKVKAAVTAWLVDHDRA